MQERGIGTLVFDREAFIDWLKTNWVELTGNGLNFLCIFLIRANNPWNWPVGIANCLFYIAIFWPLKLYADSFLMAVYICLSVYGLWFWLRGGTGGTESSITRLRKSESVGWIGLGILIGSFAILWPTLERFTDTDVALFDSALASASFLATYLTSRRKVECWPVWMATNVGYFGLYLHKGLHITQWCQIGFFLLSAVGLWEWRRWEAEARCATA
ncbi:nicotinamide riboside transporter PnuC [bacterium]|nr:MAG: nicotinamide riboside transporter PnuC [bacterium]